MEKYASDLSRQGLHLQAAVEYQRYLLFLPDSLIAERELAWIAAADAYRLGHRYDLAIRQAGALEALPSTSDSARCKSLILRARCHFESHAPESALSALAPFQAICQEPRLNGDRALLIAGSYLYLQQWEPALATARSIESGLERHQLAGLSRLQALAEVGRSTRPPRPWVAACLSATIPGAGKVYAGRRAEGLYAFFLNGLAAYQCIDGFHDDGSRSVKGWVAGAIGLLLYSGNVYGSAKTANRVAIDGTRDLRQKVDDAVERGLSR